MKKITIVLLLSQLSLFAQDYKFGKVSKEELEETFYPLDSTADAAYLYKYRRTYYDYNSTTGWFDVVTEIHNRIKIYTKEGFNNANQSIVFAKPDKGQDEKISFIKGYTFNLEGNKISKSKLSKKNIFDEKKDKYRSVKKITMPNIKIGSVIDLEYKLISPYYTYVDDLQFQHNIPVKKLDFTVEVPEYYKFKLAAKGYYFITPERTIKNRTFLYSEKSRVNHYSSAGGSTKFETSKIDYKVEYSRYKAVNIPALKDNEPFVSNIKNHRGGMSYELSSIDFPSKPVEYFSTTWEDVSKQIFKSSNFGQELNKSSYYKEDLQNILATTKTDSDKVIAIFQFVKNKVKWNGYISKYTDKGVRKAYKERVGNSADINLMLTSMLRFAGLDANPVLVSTRDNGFPLFPTLNGFNYVISMVDFKDGTYVLLDASEEFSLPNMLPTRTLNWKGRKVTKEGSSSWVKLTSSNHALEDNNVMVKISNEMIVEGMIRTRYDNLNALNYRKNNNHIKEKDLIIRFEEKHNLEIEDYKVLNKSALGKGIVKNVRFLSEDLIEEINGKIYIEPLLFLSEHKNPFKLEDRKFPVDFASPWKDRNTVSIQIPEEYKVESLPASLAIGLPDNLGVFKFQVTQKGNTISTMSILQINSAIVTPEYYLVLKDFYGQMVKKQSEKIVLIKL